ncbi:MAG: lytic transglycosylase domain-containing protein [Chloracidobacterium sp.]|nr:lytic transglycosylase domain-containing protein [Chloracidobacterium sp.]
MKSSLTKALFISLIAVVPAFSQTGPRVLDNFAIANGVQVRRTESIPVFAKTKAKLGSKAANSKSLVQKTAQVRPVVPTRMSVTEGLADREMMQPQYSSYNKLSLGSNTQMKGFTTGDAMIDSFIVDSSRRYGIDPLLIYAQMHQESSFKLKALSYKGASGLMQLMPATARRLGVTNIYDPRQNIEGGVKYMRMLLDMFGQDVNLALAGYNAGEGAVMKYGRQIPPYNETREYVRRISARYGSISDGSYARTVRRVNAPTAAKLEQKDARPLSIYEPNALAIRLADGRMRLVNQ